MPRKASNITIKEIRTKEQWHSVYPLVRQLNPELTLPRFNALLAEMLPAGYRCVGAYQGKKLLGIMGLWSASRFWCGRFIEADNVVVDQRIRSKGVGRAMMVWLDKEAKRLKCNAILADSYTRNHASHRFYLRERYDILGFSFVKKL